MSHAKSGFSEKSRKNTNLERFAPPGQSVVTGESLVSEVFPPYGVSVGAAGSVVSEVFAAPGESVVTFESPH